RIGQCVCVEVVAVADHQRDAGLRPGARDRAKHEDRHGGDPEKPTAGPHRGAPVSSRPIHAHGGQNRPTIRILRSRLGTKSLARTSNALLVIGLMSSAQKLTRRSGFCLSTTMRKSLIGPAQLAPVFST